MPIKGGLAKKLAEACICIEQMLAKGTLTAALSFRHRTLKLNLTRYLVKAISRMAMVVKRVTIAGP